MPWISAARLADRSRRRNEEFWEASRPEAGRRFHAAMVLLQAVVEVAIGPMLHFVSQHLANSPRVGVVSIRGHALWGAAGHFRGLLEELLGRGHVARRTEHAVHQVAIPAHSAIQIVPLAPDFDAR